VVFVIAGVAAQMPVKPLERPPKSCTDFCFGQTGTCDDLGKGEPLPEGELEQVVFTLTQAFMGRSQLRVASGYLPSVVWGSEAAELSNAGVLAQNGRWGLNGNIGVSSFALLSTSFSFLGLCASVMIVELSQRVIADFRDFVAGKTVGFGDAVESVSLLIKTFQHVVFSV